MIQWSEVSSNFCLVLSVASSILLQDLPITTSPWKKEVTKSLSNIDFAGVLLASDGLRSTLMHQTFQSNIFRSIQTGWQPLFSRLSLITTVSS